MGERPHIRKPKEFAWKPVELRNRDLSHLSVKLPEEMSRTEFEKR